MSNWKSLIHAIETEVDDAKYAVEKMMGRISPLDLHLYNGYGKKDCLRIGGRVLEKRDMPAASADDSTWRNFVSTAKNWFTDEIPGAKVRICHGEKCVDATSDEEGYFRCEIEQPDYGGGNSWIEADIELLEPMGESPVRTTSRIQIPGVGSEYGIISDIDDTVMVTGATRIFEMLKNTLLNNAHTRVAFEGVSALYAALSRGIDGRGRNPFFYVTSSPWNLYHVITDVFNLQGIPEGTLFMKDWGIDENKFLKSGHGDHKKKAIRDVLQFYPEMNFILVGDSGQEDPEIYTDIVNEFPDRILAVYIRDVTDDRRDLAVQTLSSAAASHGVDLLLVEQTTEIAAHAAEKGFIRKSEIPAIHGRKESDELENEKPQQFEILAE